MATVFEKYVWLIETIRRSGGINLPDLSAAWERSELNDSGKPLNERTFFRHRNAIEERFGIEIDCDRAGALYYIAEDDEADDMKRWLLNFLTVENVLSESRSLKDRILLEDIPSGQHFLSQIVSAMKEGKVLGLSYSSFKDSQPRRTELKPYFVKVFNQRWYVTGPSSLHGSELRTYALDRIVSLELLPRRFVFPEDFSPADYFAASYGIFHSDDKPQLIILRANSIQTKYLRTLPLHASQAELTGEEAAGLGYTPGEGESYFRLYLSPTFDFVQYLLSQGSELEVVAPISLRDELKRRLNAAAALYK